MPIHTPNNSSSDEVVIESIKKLKIDLTPSTIKTIKFIGFGHQFFGLFGFFYVIYLIYKCCNFIMFELKIVNDWYVFIYDLLSILLMFFCSKYLFLSGRYFKFSAMLASREALIEAVRKFAQYWRWYFVSLIVMIVSLIINLIITIYKH